MERLGKKLHVSFLVKAGYVKWGNVSRVLRVRGGQRLELLVCTSTRKARIL
mgnify:CR=1